jgi:hypothetical protein
MLKVVILVFIAAIAFCLVCIMGATVAKAGPPVVEIANLGVDDLIVRGFELTDKSAVDILAVGAGAKCCDQLYAYGWIIDADSREVVWTMLDNCHDATHPSKALVECEETIRLRPGKYEVYYHAGSHSHLISGALGKDINDLGDLVELMGDLFDINDEKDRIHEEEDMEELLMIVKSDKPAREYTPEFGEPDGNIVYINQPGRDEYHHQGFTLKETTELEVYGIGEFSDSYEVFVDGGWIINADTRKRVWAMDKWNSERAGGVSKNRSVRDVIALPGGNYIAYYATDDSHDPGEWNSPPPADPKSYGLSISVANSGDFGNVAAFDEETYETKIIDITRVRDDAFEKTGFTLKKDARVHIIGLGERDYSNDFLVDYGWIVEADGLERVWEMTAENSGHAGGAAKNCRYDGITELPAGDYIAYYRTDGSHSYGDWNAAPPFEKRKWGITLSVIGSDFDESDFVLVDEFQPFGNALVDITGLGDDEEIRRDFDLKETTRIRVMALGEGKGNRMYDYGWIENDETGEIVWEMTYRMTKHAGGAFKNRTTVANITLEEGSYTAYFITDDSHSVERFNASPPDNPERWGMIVTIK